MKSFIKNNVPFVTMSFPVLPTWTLTLLQFMKGKNWRKNASWKIVWLKISNYFSEKIHTFYFPLFQITEVAGVFGIWIITDFILIDERRSRWNSNKVSSTTKVLFIIYIGGFQVNNCVFQCQVVLILLRLATVWQK